MSHAITVEKPLRINKLQEEEGLSIYSCSGTPVDCVKLACSKILSKLPDFVISGINHGANTSISVLYSGTMGAAIEGCIHGIPPLDFHWMIIHRRPISQRPKKWRPGYSKKWRNLVCLTEFA